MIVKNHLSVTSKVLKKMKLTTTTHQVTIRNLLQEKSNFTMQNKVTDL